HFELTLSCVHYIAESGTRSWLRSPVSGARSGPPMGTLTTDEGGGSFQKNWPADSLSAAILLELFDPGRRTAQSGESAQSGSSKGPSTSAEWVDGPQLRDRCWVSGPRLRALCGADAR